MGADFICYILVSKKGNKPRYKFNAEELLTAAKAGLDELGEESTPENIKEHKAKITESIKRLRLAMKDKLRDTSLFHGRKYDYLTTGGMSCGDSPSETAEAIDYLEQAGLIGKMGFEKQMP